MRFLLLMSTVFLSIGATASPQSSVDMPSDNITISVSNLRSPDGGDFLVKASINGRAASTVDMPTSVDETVSLNPGGVIDKETALEFSFPSVVRPFTWTVEVFSGSEMLVKLVGTVDHPVDRELYEGIVLFPPLGAPKIGALIRENPVVELKFLGNLGQAGITISAMKPIPGLTVRGVFGSEDQPEKLATTEVDLIYEVSLSSVEEERPETLDLRFVVNDGSGNRVADCGPIQAFWADNDTLATSTEPKAGGVGGKCNIIQPLLIQKIHTSIYRSANVITLVYPNPLLFEAARTETRTPKEGPGLTVTASSVRRAECTTGTPCLPLPSSLKVRVQAGGEAVEGAVITLNSIGGVPADSVNQETGSDGTALLPKLKYKDYEIIVAAGGLEEQVREISVIAGEVTREEFTLEKGFARDTAALLSSALMPIAAVAGLIGLLGLFINPILWRRRV